MKNQFFLFLTVGALISSVHSESKHWQWRTLNCETSDGKGPDLISAEPARCSISLQETEQDDEPRSVKADPCFTESHNGTVRSYCNLLCPKADTVYLIKRKPQTHRSCFVFYTHQLEKRDADWFLWRSDKCRFSRIEFTIRCEFGSSRADYLSDDQLQAKLTRKRT